MAEPIIIDDGGSTRIKQIRGLTADSKLDDLLEVKPPAPHSSKDTAPGPFTQIRIVCLDATGSFNPGIVLPLIPVAPIPMAAGHTFKCFSDNDQRVEGRITATLDCELTILGVAGNKPIVECRHSSAKSQRRYIVTNAGEIQRVDINVAGPVQTFIVPPGTVYTMVVVS